MKQNNANMIFKSLALCFLILGNLTFDVLCKVPLPTSSITPTVPVKIVEEEISIPKRNACDAINRHYKVQSKEDFFSTLVKPTKGVSDYKFLFNSTDDIVHVLTNKIKAAKQNNPIISAKEVFNALTTEGDRIRKAAENLKTSVTVKATDLEKFMKEFEFDREKFILSTNPNWAVNLHDVDHNLVVYLSCSLDELKKEINAVTGKVPIDAKLLQSPTYSKNMLTSALKPASGTPYTALDTARVKAIDTAEKQGIAAFKKAVVTRITAAPTTTAKSTSLKELVDELRNYKIKTEYKYTPATSTAPANAAVTYSIVDIKVVSYNFNTSFTYTIMNASNIGYDKFFLPQFIDIKNPLAKDAFVAISKKFPSGSANGCLKGISSELSTNPNAVIEAFSKTVSKYDFNEAFASTFPVRVIENDIGDRKIKLCWLSNVTHPGQQFNDYISWLESNNHLHSKKFNDKATAVNEFFKVLQDNLDEYKAYLATVLNNPHIAHFNKQDFNAADLRKSPGKSGAPEKGKPRTVIIIVCIVVVVVFFDYCYSILLVLLCASHRKKRRN